MAPEQVEQIAPPVAAAVLEHPIVVGEQPGMGGHAHDECSPQRRNKGVSEKGLGVVEVLEDVEGEDQVERPVRARRRSLDPGIRRAVRSSDR